MPIQNLKTKVLKNLENVLDPEIPVSIVDLGLIYDIQEEGGQIKMTLTSLVCPLFGSIEEEIKETVLQIKEVKKVQVELTFDPPWSLKKLSSKAKILLGL